MVKESGARLNGRKTRRCAGIKGFGICVDGWFSVLWIGGCIWLKTGILGGMNMPVISIVTGGVLIILGAGGYLVGGADGAPASVTALIPAFFGLPLVLCGLLGLKESLLKHAMHVAAVFGLLGFLAPLGRIVPKVLSGEFQLDAAGTSMFLMVVFNGIFLGLCIKSFINARKARQAAES